MCSGVCKVFVEIRTTPIVGAGLRGMPKGIRTVDLVPARCMARPAQWRGTGTPPIGVNLSTQLPDCLLWEGFISPIYMYLSGLKTRSMPNAHAALIWTNAKKRIWR